jgi:hypothetical protein
MHNGLPKKSDAEIAAEIRSLPDETVLAMAQIAAPFVIAISAAISSVSIQQPEFIEVSAEQFLAVAPCVGGVQ